jgi:hypothetical protein
MQEESMAWELVLKPHTSLCVQAKFKTRSTQLRTPTIESQASKALPRRDIPQILQHHRVPRFSERLCHRLVVEHERSQRRVPVASNECEVFHLP